LKAYYNYIVSQCPNWAESNAIVLVLTKGYEPFLHLGSNFSAKMTAADFQQMTLNTHAESTSGNDAQSAMQQRLAARKARLNLPPGNTSVTELPPQ